MLPSQKYGKKMKFHVKNIFRSGFKLLTGVFLLALLGSGSAWGFGQISPRDKRVFFPEKAKYSQGILGATSQNKELQAFEKTNRLSRVWSDTKYIFSSPLRLTKADLKPLGLFALTTGTLLLLDETIRNQVYPPPAQGERHEMKEFFTNFKILGDLKSLLPLSGIAIAGGHFFKNERLEETGFMVLESTLISGLVTQGLKRAFGRRRPRYSDSAYDFHGPKYAVGENLNSFPSGHTTIAFAAASVVAEQYESMPAKVASYTLAGLVGIQRAYEGAHWASDVFVAAVIGTLVGKTVVKLNRARAAASGFASLRIMPLLSPRNKSAGLLLSLRF